jgi:hypothetical protein
MSKEVLIKRIVAFATDCGIEIHNVETYLRNPGEYVLEAYNLKHNPRGIDEIANVKRNSGFNYREVNILLREYRELVRLENLK